MVFCYKVITDTPRRQSRATSPRKRSPLRARHVASSGSQYVGSFDYESQSSDLLDSIPEREWRLLAALARKREDDDARERLADQFRKMWQKEKKEREIVEAETSEQYKRYIHEKRREENSWHEYLRHQKTQEHQLRKRQLLDGIRDKEQRSADLLAWVDDKKTSGIIDKAMEEEARALLAADRRGRMHEAEHHRKRLELADTQRRVDDAMKRRSAMLRDASQRLAINNALSSWETSLLRQEVLAIDAATRGNHAARAALTDARCARIARARDARLRRAKQIAAITRQMREDIRMGGGSGARGISLAHH